MKYYKADIVIVKKILQPLPFLYFFNVIISTLYSRTRAIALSRPASHDCSFVNGARKVNVCFAAASFSFVLIILKFFCDVIDIPILYSASTLYYLKIIKNIKRIS